MILLFLDWVSLKNFKNQNRSLKLIFLIDIKITIIPVNIIGIHNHWPKEKLNKISPICKSGSLKNSIKNLETPYPTKNKPVINP